MSAYIIAPSPVSGTFQIPPSKSQTLRAILFATMADGKSEILNSLLSKDAEAMLSACALFGAKIELDGSRISIEGLNGKIDRTEDVINAGNSGIVLRFCAALGSLSHHPVVITGDHSIRHQRPMAPLLGALNTLGARAASMRGDGFAPVIIKGPLRAGSAHLDGQDSQPVSALLIASAFAEGPTELHVANPGEKPWVSLTLDWLDRLGISYENAAFSHYRVGGGSRYSAFRYTVPGDFSSAAFPIAAALISRSEITLKGLDMRDPQGDKALIDILRQMGAEITYSASDQTLKVEKNGVLRGAKIDVNPIIDALPILAVVASFAEGETVLYNGAIARHKESNRIDAVADELKKMGADIEPLPDGLRIRQSSLRGACVASHHDHRLAMALTVAAIGATGETKLLNADCIQKTYPSFFHDFRACGAKIEKG